MAIIHEDDHTFTHHSGARFIKSPHTMAPGGLYHTAQADVTGIPGYFDGVLVPPQPDQNDGTPFVDPNAPVNQVAPPPTVDISQTPPAQSQSFAGTGASGSWGPTPGTTPEVPITPAAQPAMQQPGVDSGGKPFALSSSKTSSTHVDPAALAAQQKLLNQSAEATGRIGEAQSQEQKDLAQIDKQRQNTLGMYENEAQKRAESMQQTSDTYQAKLKTVLDDYSKAKIVPKGIFADDDLGQNILAGLAVSLGAIGGALSGTNKNVGLDIMNKAIDRDIEAQKVNLEKYPNQVNMLGASYQAARQAGLDNNAAWQMSKASALEQIAARYDEVARTSQSKIVVEQATINGNKLKEESSQLKMNATATHHETETHEVYSPVKMPTAAVEHTEKLRKSDAILKQLEDMSVDPKTGEPIDLGTGPIEGRYNELRGGSGSNKERTAKILQLTAEAKAAEMASPRYSKLSNEEMDKIAPTIKDPPSVFIQKIRDRRKEKAAEFDTAAGAYSNQYGVNIPPLDNDYSTFGKKGRASDSSQFKKAK